MLTRILGCILLVLTLGACNDAPLEIPEILGPASGEHVHDLRPMIRVAPVLAAENYVIEISTEPTFNSKNTLSYASAHAESYPVEGVWQVLRYSGINQKYQRYRDRQPVPWNWKTPYNLTALVGAPDGYRVVPCRDWLRFFTSVVTEGHPDPLIAINEFVSFGIKNEGTGTGYYSAYEMLTRDMGVCGNTADLVSAMAAAAGYPSKILSLKAPDQGHVVAAAKDASGWVLLDGLYNIAVAGDAQSLIRRVKEDPKFLNIPAFDNVAVPYRHFFTSTDYAYRTESTLPGISYTTDVDDARSLEFSQLKYRCSSEEREQLADIAESRISTIFFVRASYYKNGHWSPWGYSYFSFDPPLPKGGQYIDNKLTWTSGFGLPAEFLGGQLLDTQVARIVASGAEPAYDAEFAFRPDGASWLADAKQSEHFIGLDFKRPVDVRALLIRWVTPAATPSVVEIQSSPDGVSWITVAKQAVDYPKDAPNLRVDRVSLPTTQRARAWRLLSKDAQFAVEEIGFIGPGDAVVGQRP